MLKNIGRPAAYEAIQGPVQQTALCAQPKFYAEQFQLMSEV